MVIVNDVKYVDVVYQRNMNYNILGWVRGTSAG